MNWFCFLRVWVSVEVVLESHLDLSLLLSKVKTCPHLSLPSLPHLPARIPLRSQHSPQLLPLLRSLMTSLSCEGLYPDSYFPFKNLPQFDCYILQWYLGLVFICFPEIIE